MMGLIFDCETYLIEKKQNLFHVCVAVELPEQNGPLLDTWIAVVFQWLQSNARTAVWSNMLL